MMGFTGPSVVRLESVWRGGQPLSGLRVALRDRSNRSGLGGFVTVGH